MREYLAFLWRSLRAVAPIVVPFVLLVVVLFAVLVATGNATVGGRW